MLESFNKKKEDTAAKTPDNLVILDADDTLWFVEPLYDRARATVRSRVEAEGLDGAQWETLERRLDVMNVARFGLTTERFPNSCVEAYRLVSDSPNPAVEAQIRAAANAVFTMPAPLAPGAESALSILAGVARMALLSKGDERVQQSRLAASGLAPYFEAVVIVSHKDEDAFRALLDRFGRRPEQAWSVGNSLRSDIIPAVALGMRAVWIDAPVWEYERMAPDERPVPGYVCASSLVEAATIIRDDIMSVRH